jgi:hydrogenase expression/formation protein HypD
LQEKGNLRDKAELLQRALGFFAKEPMTFMEVCGTHTVAIYRSGLRSLLPKNISLVSGPGCPVCVTDQGEVDAAIKLAEKKGLVFATYGDMMRVPGTKGSLRNLRTQGSDVRVVRSCDEALDLALKNPTKEVVFLGVGFETTAPSTAAIILEAEEKKVRNFSVLCFHKLVPPALRLLAESRELKVDGFLLPGHVTVVIGVKPYEFLPRDFNISCTIAGFEPLDIMEGLVELARQVHDKDPKVSLLYARAVRPEGNTRAKKFIRRVFDEADARWRGLGKIKNSGLRLKPEFACFDAITRFDLDIKEVPLPSGCKCGEVLMGKLRPEECPLFSIRCTPDDPVGPCMVSSEGNCAACYKYSYKVMR